MKVKKVIQNGKIVYINAETNEVIDMEVIDESSNKLQDDFNNAMKEFAKKQEESTKLINELLAEKEATKEANIKAKFLEMGGNEHAYNVLMASYGSKLKSEDITTTLQEIKQNNGFLFVSSPNHEEAEPNNVQEANDINNGSFYK